MKNDFVVKYKDMENGIHNLEYRIDQDFFDEFEDDSILDASIKVKVEFNNQPYGLEFVFDIDGKVKVECDRCLEEFFMPIQTQELLKVRFGEQATDSFEADDEIVLLEEDTQIDLKQHIYEFIILSMPQRRVHPEDKNGNSLCNPAMIDALDSVNDVDPSNDPRWDKLKDLYK